MSPMCDIIHIAPCYTTTNISVFLGVVFLLFSFSLSHLVLLTVLSKHIYPFLSLSITATITQAAVTSHLHYCNSLISCFYWCSPLIHSSQSSLSDLLKNQIRLDYFSVKNTAVQSHFNGNEIQFH